MRHLGYALVVVVCSLSVALAAPKKGPKASKKDAAAQKAPKKVDPALEAEIRKREAAYYQLLAKAGMDRDVAKRTVVAAQELYDLQVKATGAKSLEAIRRLEAVMSAQQMAGDGRGAVKTAKRLYDWQVKATGATSIQAAGRLLSLASAHNTASDHVAAEKAYKDYLKVAEKVHGRESQEVFNGLMALNGIYSMQQRFDDLDNLFTWMAAVQKKLHGDKSVEYAQQLTLFAGMLFQRSQYVAAQRAYEEALAIYEAVKGKNHPDIVGALQLVGMLHMQTNQPAKAIPIFDRAIKIAETSPDMLFVLRVSTIWAVAMQYQFSGRKDLAPPLYKKAIAMTEAEIARLEKTAPDDWQIQSLVGQLGFMYRYNNDFAKAEATYVKVIKAAEKKGMPSGYEMMLADLKRLQGKNKEALALLEKGKAAMAKYAPQASTSMNSTMADILKEMGDYGRAEKLLLEYRDYLAKQFGKKHTVYGMSALMLFNVYSRAGKLKQAEVELDAYLDSCERDLATVLRAGTDADHSTYFSKNAYVLDTAVNYNLAYASKSANATRLALTTLLRRKGRVLDAAAAALATIRTRLSADDKKILDELIAARAQLAKVMVVGATAGDASFAKEVAALEDKIQKLEAQIAKKSAAYRTVTQVVELAGVQKVIPKDARLVELVNYQPFENTLTYAQIMSLNYKPRRYAAYIVGQKGDPVVVELGEAAPIEAAIEKFRKALADPDNDSAPDLGKALYDLTMAKIIPKLGGSTNILIAPDGALNVIPFSALVDDKKQFLIKKYTFTYLTSGRDLLRLNARTKAQGGGVLFADPKFDSTGAGGDGKTRGRRSADLASFKWPQLPGTAAEADAVLKTMKGLKVFRGDAATEGALKKVKGPQILHLATHGFFLPDEEPPPADASAATGAGGGTPAISMGGTPVAPGASSSSPQVENPLLRSGLALAGANKLLSGDEDGVLTALEASGLDLLGTKLVVLSACETGVGKVTNGDGVYGLRRSLVIAGAESLVMSLWQVDDFATKELMAGFYKKLAGGAARSSALRDIQLDLLSKPKYAHPFYWAAFLPAGATTPLKD